MKQIFALTLFLALVAAPAAAEEIDLIITSGTQRVWDPVGAPEENPADAWEAALSEMTAEHQGALLIDAGFWAGPDTGHETAFNSSRVDAWEELGFDAVNVTAEDHIYSLSRTMSVRARPEDLKDFFVAAVDSQNDLYPPLPVSVTVDAGGEEVRVVSWSRLDSITSIPALLSRGEQRTLETVMADAEAEEIVLLMADVTVEEAAELLEQDATEPVDVLLALRTTEGEPTQPGRAWIVPRAPGNEFMHLKLETVDGRVEGISAETTEWMDDDAWFALRQPGLPVIGMSVPGRNRVAERLGLAAEDVFLEVHRQQSFPGMTDRANIYVYNLMIEGRPFRAYRVYDIPGLNWIPFDVLAIIDTETRTLRQIVTNTPTYPLTSHTTRLGEALQVVLERDPEQWEIPQDAIAGIEWQAERVIQALRDTIAIDKEIYPLDDESR